MDFLGDAMVVHDYEVYDIHHTVSALVGLDVLLEGGIFMVFLFVMFHVLVIKSYGNYHQYNRKFNNMSRGLTAVIILNIVVGLGHWSTLFHPSILLIHTFLMALLYNLKHLNSYVSVNESKA